MNGRFLISIFAAAALLLASLDARADATDIQVVSTASSSGTFNTTTPQTFSINPGADADGFTVILVGISLATTSNTAVANVTFGGVSFIFDTVSVTHTTGTQSAQLWEFDGPPAGTGTITITYNQTVSAVAGAVALTNSTVVTTTAHNPTASGTVDTIGTTGSARDVIFDVLAVTSAVTATAGPNQTQEWNSSVGGVRGAASVETGGVTSGKWTFPTRQFFADISADVQPVNTPTAILARTLVASAEGDATLIRWRASTLGNTLGYRVYRREPGQPGGRQRVTPELIGGAALSGPEGGTSMGTRDYAWRDRGAHSSEAQYWVEEVDLNGRRRWTGPVVSVAGLASPAFVAESPTLAQQVRPRSSIRTASTRMSFSLGPSTSLDPSMSLDASTSPDPSSPVDAAMSLDAPTSPEASTALDASVAPDASGAALPAPGIPQHPVFRLTDIADPEPTQACAELASRPAVKIRVEQEGMVRVAWADLVGAGLDGDVDRRHLHLFADGVEQPLRFVRPHEGQAESIEFYGIGNDTLWSAGRTYWLTADGFAGLAAPAVPPPAAGMAGAPSGFASTIERRDRTTYLAALNVPDGDNFFGAVITTASASQALTVTHRDTSDVSPAILEVTLRGATTASHDVTVLFNGQLAGTIAFAGQALGVGNFAIPSGGLLEGANDLTLRANGDDTDVSVLVATRLTYRHAWIADDDALFFRSPAAGRIRIGGFTTDDVRLFDVTDPNDVDEVAARVEPAAGGGFAVVARRPVPPGRSLYAFADTRILGPASVRANHPSTWHRSGAQAELVIVTHGALLASVRPLVDLRRSQGWSVATAEAQDLFDEYNCGEKNPGAIQRFFQRSRSSSVAARYGLLVGDASFDPRDYLGLGDHDHVLTKLLYTSTIQTASDDWFGDFDGDGVPEIGIGRIPAATAAQAEAVVRKLLAYPAHFGGSPAARDAWASVGLFVSDDNVGYDFESEARRAEILLPAGMQAQEFFRSIQNPATAEADLVARLNVGSGLVNYLGHGSVQQWNGTLQTADVSSLTNKGQWPIFVDMTCLNALFQDPRLESLGTALLLADPGGAVAVWASATSPDAPAEDAPNQAFVAGLSQGALGDAVIQAKKATSDPDMRVGQTLLGDPSLFGAPRPSPGGRRAEGSTAAKSLVGSTAADLTGPAGGAGASSSSCSLATRSGSRTGLALGLLAIAGALFARRRSRASARTH